LAAPIIDKQSSFCEMNSTEKGDQLEVPAVSIMKKIIAQHFGHNPELVRVFTRHDKKYKSNRRPDGIYFDLTVEIWPPNADNYALIYIVECKNTSRKVEVGDLEEFEKKIEQVSGQNKKAIIICSNGVQSGAYDFAKSGGFMLIVGDSANNFETILYKKTNRSKPLPTIPFVKKEKVLIESELVQKAAAKVDSLIVNLPSQLVTDYAHGFNIPKLFKNDIEELVKPILDQIDINILEKAHTLNFSKLCNHIEAAHGIKIISITDPNMLGYCDRQNQTIGISEKLLSTPQGLFVIAHEYGHFVLHQELNISQETYEVFSDSIRNFKTGKHDLENPKQWIEWQANYFAAALLMPQDQFRFQLVRFQKRNGVNVGALYVDDQGVNREKFDIITDRLQYLYGLSKTTIINRLQEFDLLHNKSRLKSIGQLIVEYRSELHF
jgi:Zn-dependent peptidase ImmA (M78 family)/rhodanese-related sulfurtransferase